MLIEAIDPLDDDISRIELIDRMGNDLSVVNDARASFEKVSNQFSEADGKLLKYLISHKHTSPFRGVVFKFKVKAPLFVCRQWWKHVIASAHNEEQLGWNEKSFRYVSVDDANEFYIPTVFRKQSENNRQATEGQIDFDSNMIAYETYKLQCNQSYEAYSKLLSLGVGREQARGVLVPSVYTTWIWTASLQAVLYFLGLRNKPDAQGEIVEYARAIEILIEPYVPETIKAWQEITEKE